MCTHHGSLALLLIVPRKETMKSVALPLIALIAFAGYTVSVMLQAEQSLIEFGISLMSRPDTAQVVIDLYLLATLAGVWMYRDARKRGQTVWSVVPYLMVTAVFVSIGPLLYLVVRGIQDRKSNRAV
jgi:hypothetical protein